MNKEEEKELFVALVMEDGVQVLLEYIVSEWEHNMARQGGEPDLVYVLCVRLLEAMKGEKAEYSLVNLKEWKKYVLREK
jgi:TPP-dependent pyruvate/acetoin dehydrogenase alpha subunit